MKIVPQTSPKLVTIVSEAPETIPSPSRSTMDSLERRWSSLSLSSVFRKKQGQNKDETHTEPPPPYSESETHTEDGDPGAAIKQNDTWQTVPATPTTDLSTASPKPPQPDPVRERDLIARATAFIRPLPTPTPTFPRLSKPIVIPRVGPGYNVPFARAWCPSLAASHDIDRATFLALIDNLNIIMAPPLTVRAIEAAAFAVGFIPVGEYTEALSGALVLVAVAATVALTRARTKAYLARVNEELLAPRGLCVQVLGTKRIRRALGVPKEERMLVPLGEETMGLSVQERCLRRLREEGWSEGVATEGLPELGKETRALARFAAWQVRREVAGANKSAEKCRKKAWKRHLKGKKMREGKAEARRVKGLDWIVIRNADDVESERLELEREKLEGKKSGRSHALWKCVRKG